MKKKLPLVGVAAAMALTLSACGGGTAKSEPAAEAPESGGEAAAESEGQEFKIGISQLVSHPSLDASAEGFKEALSDAGLKVDLDEQNANGDQSIASSIAGTFASGDYDLVLAIATPSAQAAAQAITDTPVLFTAVTDPVAAELVDTAEVPGGNMTGTSDANPVGEQLDLITKIVPDAKKLGVIYTPGETNSLVQLEWVKESAKVLGLEVVEATVTKTDEVLQAAESLSSVDAIYVPTDNNVVTGLESVLKVGEEKKIPVFGAEGDSVARGTIGTYGLSYHDLGYQTGEMAIRILVDGEDPAVMAVETQTTPMLYLNEGAAERMGVTIPQELLDEVPAENLTK